jgi:A-macroglobulin TED domain/Alpha-2-macroglobulin family
MLEERRNFAVRNERGRGPGREPAADRPVGALRAAPAAARPLAQMDAKRERAGGFGLGVGDVKEKEMTPPQPLVIREYAHRRQSSAGSDVRRDFTETLYWHPVLVLPDGKGEVRFDLCDSVTTFQVAAIGHTLDGRLGSATTTLEARKPFTLEPKIPLEVTADDKIDVPVSVANNTTSDQTAVVKVMAEGLKLLSGQQLEELPLGADQRRRLVYRLQPDRVEGAAQLYLEGNLAGFEGDKVLHTFQVVPQGFPAIGSKSDMLENAADNMIELPKDWLKETLKARVEVYPSTLADLQKGLAALLREPNGCFEQTSSSNYPNLLILDYLKETDQAQPETESRARELLARGMQKLVSFECPYTGKGRNGFEWFGAQNSAHEALTAYGLMQFRDLSRVQEVDQAMVERTRQWLLSRKDGKGGFQRNPRALDTFGRAPEDITNAYIVWAVTESSKDDDVQRELDRLHEQAKGSKDPYFLSLVANSLLNRGRPDDAVTLLKQVADVQKTDGQLEATATSITGSGGRDLQIETTALAVLGWLKANRPADFTKPVQSAVKWIGQQRGGRGGFGSTQSTILALKALIAFAKANKKTPQAGELALFVGDRKVAELKFPAGASDTLALDLPEPEKHLKTGKNAVRVEITGKNVFPYTLSWSYQTLQPLSAERCPVNLEARLDRLAANEGDQVRLTAVVQNVSGKGQGMAVAILGLPAGLSVPEDMKQLKEHTRVPTEEGARPLVSAFEIRGRELVLYWRDLAPDQKIEVPIDLVCRVPGEYSGPASRAYLYYNADHKHWVAPLKVAIAAKAE